jgi:hypothetical protein
LLLAGCWRSSGSLFADVKPAQPFAAGKTAFFNPAKPDKINHAILTRNEDGSYRLTLIYEFGQGEAVALRFIALPGLPKDVFAFEAVSDNRCGPGETCHSATASSERNYGLVRQIPGGAEVTDPDCDTSSPAAKLPGVKAGNYGICSFTSRASLEAALLGLAKQGWKTTVVYKYE